MAGSVHGTPQLVGDMSPDVPMIMTVTHGGVTKMVATTRTFFGSILVALGGNTAGTGGWRCPWDTVTTR